MMGELTGWIGTQIAGFSPLVGVMSLVISCLTVAAAIGLFSHGLTKRAGFFWRGGALVLASIILFGVAGAVAGAVGNAVDPAASYVIAFALYSVLLGIYIVGVLAVCETTIWTALFCATSGYTVQNLASGSMELVASVLRNAGVDPSEPWIYALSYGLCIAATFFGAYHLLAKRVGHEGLAQVESRSMVAMMPVVSLVIIGFDVMIKAMDGAGLALGFVVLLRLLHGLACVATLWVEYQMLFRQRLEHDREVAERLLAEHDRQLRMSQENIEAINIKCHDLRHQIRALAESGAVVDGAVLDDLAREVRVYDSSVKTGNDALDTILTEKRLVCEARGITLTCTADGEALGHMAPADLYALFGNALDNAIEAAGELADPARRTVTLVVRRAMGCASIHVENFYDGQRRFGADGMPLTTKADEANHGFGTRSMRQIAERYGGSFAATADGGAFRLDILIPLP